MGSHGKGRTGSQSRKRSGGEKREGCGRRSDGAGWDTFRRPRNIITRRSLGCSPGWGAKCALPHGLEADTAWTGCTWGRLDVTARDGLWKPVVSGQYPGKDEGHG